MAQRKLEQITDDDLFADWRACIQLVYQESVDLAWNRRVYRRMLRVFEKNEQLQKDGSHLWDWMMRNYISGAGMTLRRELDRQEGHPNLRSLLGEIEKRPKVLTRRRYYGGWGAINHHIEEAFQERDFNRYKVVSSSPDPLDDHIDPESVRRDRVELMTATKAVLEFVETTIAHRGQKEEAVTFKQFDAAIDAIVPIFHKYFVLLTQSSVARMEPVPQFNEHAAFTFPWDITCFEMWEELTKDKRLDWKRMIETYRVT